MKDEIIVELLNKLDNRTNDNTIQLHEIAKVQVRQEEILKEHVRRSLANEEAVKILKDELKIVFTFLEVCKICAKVFVSIGGATLLIKIFEKFFN